eukprot:2476594-Prymnesium_polylepis.1
MAENPEFPQGRANRVTSRVFGRWRERGTRSCGMELPPALPLAGRGTRGGSAFDDAGGRRART